MDEQTGESGDSADEDDELAEARDEQRDDQHEDVDTVIIRRRQGAMAVIRANGEARYAHPRVDEQLEDVIAGPSNVVNCDTDGDGSVFWGREISVYVRPRPGRKRRRTNRVDGCSELGVQLDENAVDRFFRAGALDQDVLLGSGGCTNEGDAGKSCDSDSEEAREEHC